MPSSPAQTRVANRHSVPRSDGRNTREHKARPKQPRISKTSEDKQRV